ncbi:hypothetical protein BH20CHL6_BH20CHL6_14310 [soil metagenome]
MDEDRREKREERIDDAQGGHGSAGDRERQRRLVEQEDEGYLPGRASEVNMDNPQMQDENVPEPRL